jgi:hypothetical protein
MSIDTFVGGREGAWETTRIQAIAGDGLDMAPRLSIVKGVDIDGASMASWLLRGAASHVRHSTRSDLTRLAQGSQDWGVTNRRGRCSFPWANRRTGGSSRRTSGKPSSESRRAMPGSAWTIFLLSHGAVSLPGSRGTV